MATIPQIPDDIPSAPGTFAHIVQALNALLSFARPFAKIEGRGGIRVHLSGSNVIVDASLLKAELAEVNQSSQPRTFFAKSLTAASVVVSAGAIQNVYVSATTFTTVSSGDKIYIRVTLDAAATVTACEVLKASAVPANTTTGTRYGHKLLANCTVSGGQATAVPVGWNFSEVQLCGTSYIWGGFGA